MKFVSSACKRLIHKAVSFLVKPITCQPAFFVLLFVLLGALDIYSLLVLHSVLPVFKASVAFLSCYILALPVVFLTERLRKIYKVVLLVFATIFFIVDIYLLLLYNETFSTINKNAIAAVLATNPNEMLEYINAYFTFANTLILFASVSAVLVLFCYLRKQSFKWNGVGRFVLLILLFLSALKSLVQFNEIKDGNLYYFITKKCPDLREYRQSPSVGSSNERIDNIVLVIGESFSKLHSSLYGYEKKTNPRLETFEDGKALFVYKNVTSACGSTIPAIKSIMMAYTDCMSDSIEWFRCLTLIEVMQNAGYRTFWFSNQSKYGVYDNEIGRVADLCDEQFFIGQSMSKFHYDEELLTVIDDCLMNNCQSRLVVVHMAGSHAEYNKRYPSLFSKFKSDDYDTDYSHLSLDKKQILSEYDNSIYYNDSVVYELMTRFEHESAVVVYLSDHGEDVFYSSDDFYGHFDNSRTKVEQHIPFMVYTSQLFREKHPELQKRIENAVNRPYRTDSIMYTIMDIAGVETVNGISYKHKSLFK